MNSSSSVQRSLPIVCTALNAAIDKRLHVGGFRVGQVHRATSMEATAGGKGLNVARVAKSLGASVLASGFAGGSNGTWIMNRLEECGIAHRLVPIGGETRTCLNILDDSEGTSTEILESGPEITAEEASLFLDTWRTLCAPGMWITLSGSLPRGLGHNFYGILIAQARAVGANVVLDTSGSPFDEAVRHGPHTVKPNEEEFRQWSDADPRDDGAVRSIAGQLGQNGVHTTIVSLGREGCVAATPSGELWRARPPAIQAVNAVGSGDAFVAGWTVACSLGLDMPGALRLAVAAGTANAMTPGTGQVRAEDVRELMGRVELERR